MNPVSNGSEMNEDHQAVSPDVLLNALFEQAADGVFITDAEGRYIEVNQRGCEMLGYTRDELFKLKMTDLIPPADLSQKPMPEIQVGKMMISERKLICKDGSLLPVEINASRLKEGGYIGVVRDISPRKEAQKKERRAQRLYATLSQVNQTIVKVKEPQALFEAICQVVVDFGKFRMAWIGLLDEGKSPAKAVAWAGVENGYLQRSRDELRAKPDLADMINNEICSGNVIVKPELKTMADSFPGYETAMRNGYASLAMIPFRQRGKVIGILNIFSEEANFFSSDELNLVEEIGLDISFAMDTIQTEAESRQRQQVLEESEARFRAVFEQAAVGMTQMAPDGSWIDVNQVMCDFLGYSKKELLEKTFLDISHPADAELNQRDLARALAGEIDSFYMEKRYYHKDGRMVWGDLTVSLVRNADGSPAYFVSVIEDSTERVHAQRELATNEERLRKAQWVGQIGSWEYNPETNEIWGSEGGFRMFGLPIKDGNLPIDVIESCIPERDRVNQALIDLWAEAKPYDLVYAINPADGSPQRIVESKAEIQYDEQGNPSRVVGVVRDVTERHRAEERIRAMNQELEQRVEERTHELNDALVFVQSIFSTARTGFAVYDETGLCMMANDAIIAIVGGSREQVLQQNLHQIPSWKTAGLYDLALKALQTGELQQMDAFIVTSFGKEVWLDCHFATFQSGGKPNLLLTVSDISERKQREKEIQNLNDLLQEQTERLKTANQELEAFSYSVSHDLRAPLRAIDGYTRILLEDYESELDDEGKRLCGVIRGSTERMGQLIDDLLAFSRLGRAQMQRVPVGMRALAAGVFRELSMGETRERIDFRLADLPEALGDATMLRQVWVNLISNAIKFTAKREKPLIEVGWREDGVYYVRDNGAGFDMRYADKLFGVFQRLHSARQFEGTGVGLAIVQRIVHRHGGIIWAEAEEGHGAAFYFRISTQEKESE